MRLNKFLTKSRIIETSKTDFGGVVSDLLSTVPETLLPAESRPAVRDDLIEREKAISTYLGDGICMPHTRVRGLKQKYVFAVGRTPNGIKFNGSDEYSHVRIVVMLLSNENVDTYLQVLSALAHMFSHSELIQKLDECADINAFRLQVMDAFSDGASAQKLRRDAPTLSLRSLKREERINALLARSAVRIAKASKCSSILLQGDLFKTQPDLFRYFGDFNVVVMTEKNLNLPIPNWNVINVRSFSSQRFSQLRSAIMIGLTRGIFNPKDKICCVGGVRNSNIIDTLTILDIELEFADIFIQRDMLPAGVKPEVVERIIDIATELSIEGREGKPVGCIFVLGKFADLKPHLKQLILNPFYGYKPEDRNVLNPFMDETVKEFSLIDGAFIIDGSGILEAAGALIHTPDFKLQLPGGLGARHAAAYAISLIADCISLVVSSSTGQITIFRKGQMMPISEKRR